MDVVVVLPCVPPMATTHFQAHQFGQHFGAADDGEFLARAATSSGLSGFDGGGDDDGGGVFDICGVVADEDLDAVFAQAVKIIAFGQVGALRCSRGRSVPRQCRTCRCHRFR